MEFCASEDWRRLVHETILPEALRGVELGDEAIEIGPGPGLHHRHPAHHDGAPHRRRDRRGAGGDRWPSGWPAATSTSWSATPTALEFPADRFSGAASFHMLHHIAPAEAQDRVFAELARVLVPGGVLVAADGVYSEGSAAFHEGDTYNPIDPEELGAPARPRRVRGRGRAHLRPRVGVHGARRLNRAGPDPRDAATVDRWARGPVTCPSCSLSLAAFCNALNMVTQHIASISDPGHSKGWRFVRYLVSNPLWLFGWVALAGAFVFQALALHNGQMSVVQPLLVTELVFALVLRRLWIRQQIRAVTWWAAAVTCGALAALRRRVRADRRQRRPDQLSLGRRHRRHRAGPRRSCALCRSAARPCAGPRCSGLRPSHALGAGRDVHQGDDRHAHPVRAGRHVHALADLRAGRGGPRGRAT